VISCKISILITNTQRLNQVLMQMIVNTSCQLHVHVKVLQF